MSPRTLFLSRLIGLYCILVALSMMTRRQATVETVTTLLQNPAMMNRWRNHLWAEDAY